MVPSTRVCPINTITEEQEESSTSTLDQSELLSTNKSEIESSPREFMFVLNISSFPPPENNSWHVSEKTIRYNKNNIEKN